MGYDSIWHWLFLLVFLLLGVFLSIIPVWRIVSKAGFHGAFALLMLVPVVNIIMLWVFAFAKWPVERDAG
mgnify:CR=1 FL=1